MLGRYSRNGVRQAEEQFQQEETEKTAMNSAELFGFLGCLPVELIRAEIGHRATEQSQSLLRKAESRL
jgi:hypothetical protein